MAVNSGSKTEEVVAGYVNILVDGIKIGYFPIKTFGRKTELTDIEKSLMTALGDENEIRLDGDISVVVRPAKSKAVVFKTK